MDKETLQLEDKKFLATSKENAKNTDKIVGKLDELKPTGEIKLTQIPDDLKSLMADWSMAAQFVKSLSESLKVRGEQGEKGEPGDPGEQGEPGKNGENGKDGIDGQAGANGQDGLNGIDGKDGSPDTAEQIAEKLQTLKESWLKVTAIQGFEEYMRAFGSSFLDQAKGFVPRSLSSLYDVNIRNIADQQSLIWSASQQKFVPGSATASGGGFTKLLSTETPDGTNTVFTYSQKPLYIISGGAWYEENNGWTWNAGASQATLSVAPPSQALQLLAFV